MQLLRHHPHPPDPLIIFRCCCVCIFRPAGLHRRTATTQALPLAQLVPSVSELLSRRRLYYFRSILHIRDRFQVPVRTTPLPWFIDHIWARHPTSSTSLQQTHHINCFPLLQHERWRLMFPCCGAVRSSYHSLVCLATFTTTIPVIKREMRQWTMLRNLYRYAIVTPSRGSRYM